MEKDVRRLLGPHDCARVLDSAESDPYKLLESDAARDTERDRDQGVIDEMDVDKLDSGVCVSSSTPLRAGSSVLASHLLLRLQSLSVRPTIMISRTLFYKYQHIGLLNYCTLCPGNLV